MELKRAAELTICALLREALPDLTFYPSRGGGDDVTPAWQANHFYKLGDVLKPTAISRVHAIVVLAAGNSGSTEPDFDDVVNGIFAQTGKPTYKTISDLSVLAPIDSSTPVPPFGVVSIDDGEKTMATEETDFLEGVAVWVTRADATNIVTHSGDFKRFYDAMTNIGSGYDIMRRLMVHGLDVKSTDEFTDADRQAHGDTISFTMGVSEMPAQG